MDQTNNPRNYPNKPIDQGSLRNEKGEIAYNLGLTKREWLAGMALHGLLMENEYGYGEKEKMCGDAVRYADILIIQLDNK